MTHTIHKFCGGYFGIVVMSSGKSSIGDRAERIVEAAKILKKHKPRNLGDMKTCNIYMTDYDTLLKKIRETSKVNAVFDRETIPKVLSELKEKDLGVSVCVSGDIRYLRRVLDDLGIRPHTYHISLGVFGKTNVDDDTLAIISMCGHGLVSKYVIGKLEDKIVEGKITVEDAAITLAKQCVCGMLDPGIASKYLKNLLEKEDKSKDM